MYLSKLQKFILLILYDSKKRKVDKKEFLKFYNTQKKKSNYDDQVNAIAKSIDRLVKRGLLIAWGYRTRKKWYNKDVSLTGLGRKEVRRLLGQQMIIPFRKLNIKNKK